MLVSTTLINTIMSRGLHLSQVFDLEGKVAFVTGKWLIRPEEGVDWLMSR